MPITNKNIKRARKLVYIPATQLSGVASVTLASLTLTEGTPNTLSASSLTLGGFTAAAAVLQQINSTGNVGLKMSTNGNAVLHDWLVPSDLDPAYETRIRCHWATESTTSGHGALFTITRKAYVNGTTALSATVDTALSTAIVADTVGSPGTAYKRSVTAPGVINAGALTPGQLNALKIAMTTKTGATDIWLLGLEVQYVPAISPSEGVQGAVEANTWT